MITIPSSGPGAQPRIGFNLRTLLLVLALTAILLPALWLQIHTLEREISIGLWGLVVLSALANIIVIAYHYVVPAHPKFRMVPWRRVVLGIHIASGTVELVAGLMACFGQSRSAAIIMGITALFFHVPSAFLQVRIVFGCKAIMVPAYLFCILAHGFSAGMLLADPSSTMWAVNTFLAFNVYVWCRIYFYLFDTFNLFTEMKYSISILAAGATMVGAILGPLGFILMACFIGTYVLIYRQLFIRSPAEYAEFVREHTRASAGGANLTDLSNIVLSDAEMESLGRACHAQAVRDEKGAVDRKSLATILAPWGLAAPMLDGFIDRQLAQGPLDFDRFKREIWSIGAVRQHAIASLLVERASSDREKAELVFRYIDTNSDGWIDLSDLQRLLAEWGLPDSEANLYLRGRDSVATGRVAFGDFLREMEPVWRFVFHEVFRAEFAARKTEMIGRGVTAVTETRRAASIRKQVKCELLNRVPFLAGASETLIADLATSLVTERFAAGKVIFAEDTRGDSFYLVAAGGVRVTKHGEALADLGPGACIGEGCLLTDHPRAATVIAIQDSTLFSLKRAAFAYLTETYPEIREQLSRLHEERRTDTTKLVLRRRLAERLPFVEANAAPALIDDLAGRLQPVFCAAGDVLLREGETGDRMYLIERGRLYVERRGERLATLGEGGCIGEGALLDATPRSASVVASEDSHLLMMDRSAFQSLLGKYPAMRDSLIALHQRRSTNVSS